MTTFRYRAATSSGSVRSGALDGDSREDVILQLRRMGLRPIETTVTKAAAMGEAVARGNSQTRQAVVNAIGELAVIALALIPQRAPVQETA